MKKNQKYRKQRKNKKIVTVVMGVGLILFGIALFSMLQKTGAASASAPVDRSVVPLAVNYPAPALALENVNGKTEMLADFRGQVLLVNNWATWCPPCKAEMPSLEKYYEAHAAEGFTLVAVSAGDPQPAVEQFVKDFGLTFHVWLDPNETALQAFKNGNLPNSYVIDRGGTVRYAWTGEINLGLLEKFVTPVIKEQ